MLLYLCFFLHTFCDGVYNHAFFIGKWDVSFSSLIRYDLDIASFVHLEAGEDNEYGIYVAFEEDGTGVWKSRTTESYISSFLWNVYQYDQVPHLVLSIIEPDGDRIVYSVLIKNKNKIYIIENWIGQDGVCSFCEWNKIIE